MRVIAGIAKGRRLRAATGTRPTADSVKEALFSTLGPRVAGSRVLDLYAGSGALGIEALSRGAETATFVERDPRAVSVIRSNLEAVGFSDQARVVEAPVHRFLASGQQRGVGQPGTAVQPGAPRQLDTAEQPDTAGQGTASRQRSTGRLEPSGTGEPATFDLVLADPPYAEDPAGVLDLLSRSSLLAPDVLVALEVAAGNVASGRSRDGNGGRSGGNGPGSGGGLTVRSVRRYGDSAILYAGFAEPEERTGSAAETGGGGTG